MSTEIRPPVEFFGSNVQPGVDADFRAKPIKSTFIGDGRNGELTASDVPADDGDTATEVQLPPQHGGDDEDGPAPEPAEPTEPEPAPEPDEPSQPEPAPEPDEPSVELPPSRPRSQKAQKSRDSDT